MQFGGGGGGSGGGGGVKNKLVNKLNTVWEHFLMFVILYSGCFYSEEQF